MMASDDLYDNHELPGAVSQGEPGKGNQGKEQNTKLWFLALLALANACNVTRGPGQNQVECVLTAFT